MTVTNEMLQQKIMEVSRAQFDAKNTILHTSGIRGLPSQKTMDPIPQKTKDAIIELIQMKTELVLEDLRSKKFSAEAIEQAKITLDQANQAKISHLGSLKLGQFAEGDYGFSPHSIVDGIENTAKRVAHIEKAALAINKDPNIGDSLIVSHTDPAGKKQFVNIRVGSESVTLLGNDAKGDDLKGIFYFKDHKVSEGSAKDAIELTIKNVLEKVPNELHALIANAGALIDKLPDALKRVSDVATKLADNEAVEKAGHLLKRHLPKLAALPALAIADVVAGVNDASANNGNYLDKSSALLKTATKDIGGNAAREMVNGNYDAAQRDIIDKIIPGADLILRSSEAQAIINALPKDKATLTQMQIDMKLPSIDRHLAEYQLRVIESSAKSELLEGLSASMTLTDLAEKKILLKSQWKIDAETFKTAAADSKTDWIQFKKDHKDLVVQADFHIKATKAGHGQEFVAQMDANIAKLTANGAPMQPIAQQLVELTSKQQNHSVDQNAQHSLVQ